MTPAEIQAELEAMNAELNEVLHRYEPRLEGMRAVAMVVRTPRGLGVFSPLSHADLRSAFADLAVIYQTGHKPYAAVPPRSKARG